MELIKPQNKNQEKILEICNKIRKLYGCKSIDGLPKGVPKDPFRCPICKSIPSREEIYEDGEYLYAYAERDAEKIATVFKSKILGPKDEYYAVKVPSYVKEFWKKFDSESSHYKQLISDEPIIDYEQPPETWINLINNVEKV